jgi:hypothetical protein
MIEVYYDTRENFDYDYLPSDEGDNRFLLREKIIVELRLR